MRSYGWWMVLVMDVIAIVSGGVWTYGFGAFILPLTKEFNWSRAEISFGISLSRLEGHIEAPISGYLTDRFGPRVVMLIGLAIFASGFILLGLVNSLMSFYIVLLYMSIGYGLGFFMPMVTVVANWFKQNVGKAMGLFQAGYGGCGLVIPVLVWLIYQYGWRTTTLIVGVGLIAICLPAIFAIRGRPEDLGSAANGHAEAGYASRSLEKVDIAAASAAPAYEEGEFTLYEALRSRSFWYIAIAHGITGFAYHALIIHEIPYLVSIGISAEIAALGLTLITIISTAGRLGFGWLGDIFPKRFVMAACFGLQLVGTLIFAGIQNLWLLFLSIIIFSPGNGGQMPMRVALQREYYGRKAFGVTQGTMTLASAVISAMGPTLAGWIFDISGSYRPAFLITSVAYVIAIVLIVAATPPKPKAHESLARC
ncbi:MAG: MFS transporter [Chloroflexota bacterium]